MSTEQQVTVRANGKTHPAIIDNGALFICCSCPGSQNGKLANRSVVIAKGHDAVNCRPLQRKAK